MTGGLDKRPYPLYNTIMTQTKFDLAIVGGGIAGYTAALVSESLKLNYVWLGEERFGRKLLSAEYVRNYPAVTGSGADFAAALSAQAEKENVRFTPARIGGIFAAGGEFLLSCGQEAYSARAVILATGVELRGSVKGESEFLGKGVSYCAVCDGALYRGKRVAVFLYDAKYAEEVEYLAGFAARIDCFCLCPAPDFKAENIFSLSERPLEVTGAERVRAVRTAEGEVSADGVFVLKNSAPPSALVGGLQTEGGHVKVARDGSTNLKGLFAAGDVTGKPYQYVKAAGEGCTAAYSASAYLKTLAKA